MILTVVAVWLSGNAFFLITNVTPCQVRLVLGWVTICLVRNQLIMSTQQRMGIAHRRLLR